MRRPTRRAPRQCGSVNPARVSFEGTGSAKKTYAVRGHVVEVVNDAEEEEEGANSRRQVLVAGGRLPGGQILGYRFFLDLGAGDEDH
jgi:hypothetical protein